MAGGIRNRTATPKYSLRDADREKNEQQKRRYLIGCLTLFVALILFVTLGRDSRSSLQEVLNRHQAAQSEAEQDPAFQALALAEARQEASDIKAEVQRVSRDVTQGFFGRKGKRLKEQEKAKPSARASPPATVPKARPSARASPPATVPTSTKSAPAIPAKQIKSTPTRKGGTVDGLSFGEAKDASTATTNTGGGKKSQGDLTDDNTERIFRPGVGRVPPGHSQMPKRVNISNILPDKYIIAAAIETPFMDALGRGLPHLFRIGAHTHRAVVVPRTRLSNHCSFRTTRHAAYFDSDAIFNVNKWANSFGCSGHVELAEWEGYIGVIDALLVLDDSFSSPEIKRKCKPGLLKELRTGGLVQRFRRGVSVDQVAVDSLRGSYPVKEIICVSASEAKKPAMWKKITEKLSNIKTLAVAHPYPSLMRQPFEELCNFQNNSLHKRTEVVPVANWWTQISNAVAQKMNKNDVCLQVNAKSLVAAAQRSVIPTTGKHTPENIVRLEKLLSSCIHNIGEAIKKEVGGDGNVFVVSDLLPGPGGAVNLGGHGVNKYFFQDWQKKATKMIGSLGSGYCGSQAHRTFVANGAPNVLRDPRRKPLAAIMYSNPRVCSLVEAVVCRASQRRLQFGQSLIGNWSRVQREPGSKEMKNFDTCQSISEFLQS